MVVEGDAGADDVDEGRALMPDRRLDQRHELRLVAGKAPRHEARAELQRDRHEIDGIVGVGDAALGFRAAVGVAENWPFVRPYTPLFSTI